jgi:hypothetical protein
MEKQKERRKKREVRNKARKKMTLNALNPTGIVDTAEEQG